MVEINTTDVAGLSDNLTLAQLVALIAPLFSTDTVDQTSSATFGLTNADIHNNGAAVQMVDKDLDADWSRAGNVVSYAGDPDHVDIVVTINALDVGASNYWSRPKLRILRGGSVIAVIDDLVMQTNGAYDGDATITGGFFDKMPGANPAYTFEWFDRENRTATLAPEGFSQVALKAVNLIEVLVP